MKLEELKDINAPVSASSIICGVKCRRRTLFRYLWGLIHKVEAFSAGKIGGKLFHRLLQLGSEGVERVREEVATEQRELMQRIQEGEDLMGDLARTAQNLTDLFNKALAMVTIFWELYPQPDHLETIGKEIRIELEDVPQIPKGHIAKGFLDSLVRNKDNGDIWIRDAKTTGRPLKFAMLGYAWSIPCRFYRYITYYWLEKNGHDPSKLKGIILDMAQTPTIKYCPNTKDKGGFDSYIDRVKKWYAERGDEAMMSKGILYTEPLLPPELVANLNVMHFLLSQPKPLDPTWFPKDTTGTFCKEYERECPYYNLCNSDVRMWPQIIERQFTVLETDKEKGKSNE